MNVMKESARIGVPLALLAGGIAGFAALSRQGEIGARSRVDNRAPLVQTVAVERHEGGLDIEVDGLVRPYREIGLAAEVGGRITFKTPEHRAGNYVTKGTLLVEIDPQTYKLEVDRLTNELNQSEINLQELDVETNNTEALLELAEKDWALQKKQLNRTQKLYEREVATESEVDQALQKELTARNTVQTLRNQLQRNEVRRRSLQQARELTAARLQQAKLELEKTQVRAPVDGVVVSDQIEEGSYVQPGAPLLTIEDTSAVEIRSSLRMEQLQWLWQQAGREPADGEAPINPAAAAYEIPRTPVTVVYELGGRESTWEGVLSRYEGLGLDEQTRTVPVRVTVPEPRVVKVDGSLGQAVGHGPPALVRGMYVTVRIHTQPRTTLLRVPAKGGRPGNVVWRVREGRLEILNVRAAVVREDSVLVDPQRSGLAAGDRVIVSPLAVATEGMPVREESSP